MPFYTYRCPQCGHEETVLRSVADRAKPIYHCDHGPKRLTMPMLLVPSVPSVRVKNPAVPRRDRRG